MNYLRAIRIGFPAMVSWLAGRIDEAECRRRVAEARRLVGRA